VQCNVAAQLSHCLLGFAAQVGRKSDEVPVLFEGSILEVLFSAGNFTRQVLGSYAPPLREAYARRAYKRHELIAEVFGIFHQ
jgi:hypothetical protein